MEITKREVLFSSIIILIMLSIGFVINGKINDALLEEYQQYNTAIQINNDTDLFIYGMQTNVGCAFVYGDLKAVDIVTYKEIGGKYLYVKKVEEHYTQHSRTVTKTKRNSDGSTSTYTEIEYYWTWDMVDSWSQHSKKISFLNVEFDYGAIPIPHQHYITTIRKSYYVRYVYYGTDIKFSGTLSADLKENTINNADFYCDLTIEETINQLESKWQLLVFWIFWIILIVGCVICFYEFENSWLED